MSELTVIALDMSEITRDPKVRVFKFHVTMTLKHLKRRLQNAIIELGLPYGELSFYQKGVRLRQTFKSIIL